MGWSELLLVLLFVVLPLLQQLLERRAPGRPPVEAEPEEYEEAIEAEQRRRRPLSPAEAAGELAGREVLAEDAARELVILQRRLPAETVPEAVRVSSPVVSTEAPGASRAPRRSLRPPPSPATTPPRRAPRVEPLLRGREELRRAVVLSEILGPPKSQR